MPRYFFHVLDGYSPVDDTGIELPDDAAARHEIIQACGGMLTELDEARFWNGEDWMMEVRDETGRTVAALRVTGSLGS